MSERYKKRFYLAHRLYASGAPVLIESGSLLYDASSNAALCQLVFRNIQDKPIKALRAVVQCLDSRGEALEKPVDHRYLELELKREEETGRESAIVLPSAEARAFSVRLSQVSFADGEVWTDEDVEWSPLPEPPELEDFCGSAGKAESFRRRFGPDCREAPLVTEELWFCVCGAVNRSEEPRCHRCRRRRSALLSWSVNGQSAEPRDGAEDDEADASPLRKPLSRRARLLLGIAAGLILAGGAAAALLLPRAPAPAPPPDERAAEYAAAAALLEDGDYERAESAFLLLGDYEDSAARAAECRDALEKLHSAQLREGYDAAAALLETGSYREARAAFLALGDYEDSETMAREALYRKAQALFRFVTGHDLRGVCAALCTEPEGEDLFYLPRDRALELGSQGISDLQAACGKDPFRFVTQEGSERELKPLEDALAELYGSLGDYKDSAAQAELLPTLADRSDAFFALCEAGDLAAARDWLDSYTGPFDDRELWLQRLDLYLPFCGDWMLVEGDPTLLPMIGGSEDNCMAVRSAVLLREDEAVLRLLLHPEDSKGPEFTAEMDADRFYLEQGDLSYMVLITDVGNLSVAKYTGSFVISGVNYSK